jgi:DNA-binding SARP family transcriptional activator
MLYSNSFRRRKAYGLLKSAATRSTKMLEVHLLGQFDVRLKGEQVEIPSRPAQSLFAYLILRSGTSHRREKLAGLLWPDSDESNARANLRHALWRIRKAIGDGYITADKITIEFDPEAEYWLDADVLEGNGSGEKDLLSTVSVYGGELLPGFFDDWAVLDRERFRATFETRIQHALDSLLEQKEWTKTLEWAERWIALGDVPEPAYRALMMANAGMGDTAGVATAFKRCETALRDDLSVEPSEQTQRLFDFLSQGGQPSSVEAAKIAAAKPQSSVTAIQALMNQWREQGVEELDVVSLAMINSSPSEVKFDGEDASLLIRSALQHDVDVEPWLNRLTNPDAAVGTLLQVHAAHPRHRVRMKIVDALKTLDTDTASDVLHNIGTSDESGDVRAEAGLELARRKGEQAIVPSLIATLGGDGKSASLQALAAIADAYGLPQDLKDYPSGRVRISVWQKRWASNRTQITRNAMRIAIAGGISMLLVATVPMINIVANPEGYSELLELIPLPTWIVTNMLVGFVWGASHAGASGLALGIVDSLSVDKVPPLRRFTASSVGGLFMALFVVFTAAVNGNWTSQPPQVYVPVYLIAGILMAGTLMLVIPPFGTGLSGPDRVRRTGIASLLIVAISFVSVFLAYGADLGAENALSDIFLFLIYAITLPLGVSLTQRTHQPLSESSDIAKISE